MSSTRCVAYLRVSTAQQAEHGISLDAQRAKVELYCRLYDLQPIEVIVDAGASAKTLDRPGLQKALGALRDGRADALLVVKLDRLTRSVKDLGVLLDEYFSRPGGPALLCVQEQVDTRSAGGRLVLNVLMSVAQWERETIGERTSAALQHKKANGQYTGGHAPYGWKVSYDQGSAALIAHPSEQEVIRIAARLRSYGWSLRAIGARLLELGHRPRIGERWHASSVKIVLEAGRSPA